MIFLRFSLLYNKKVYVIMSRNEMNFMRVFFMCVHQAQVQNVGIPPYKCAEMHCEYNFSRNFSIIRISCTSANLTVTSTSHLTDPAIFKILTYIRIMRYLNFVNYHLRNNLIFNQIYKLKQKFKIKMKF